jgi:hypothetical protein
VKRQLQRGDVFAIIAAAAFVVAMLALPFLPAHQIQLNWGFDSRWNCTNPGIDPICIKRLPGRAN